MAVVNSSVSFHLYFYFYILFFLYVIFLQILIFSLVSVSVSVSPGLACSGYKMRKFQHTGMNQQEENAVLCQMPGSHI